MKKTLATLTLLIICISSAMAMRKVSALNDNWTFRFAHQVSGPGQRVDLPHTWNAGDALAGKPDYFRGTGIYEKTLMADPKWKSKRVFLRFHGANEIATVFVDDKFAGEHRGGYGAFVIDITDYITSGEKSRITVKVNNALNLDIMPLVGDFNMYGGIYRPLDLIVVDPIHISLTDYASPGIYLTQNNVSTDKAEVNAVVMISNYEANASNATLNIAIWDGENKIIAKTIPVTLPADSTTRVSTDIELSNPRLWNGIDDPFIYTVTAEVMASDGESVDRVEQPLGLRYFNVDSDKGFTLNGHPLKLRGVCRHQDRAERGNALYPEHHAEDADLIEEIGANAVRLAHYPQAKEFYDLMDRKGMIVWAEIPFIGPGGYHDRGFNNIPAFLENGRQQLREMIRQHYNHPSICFWGIFNELKTHGDTPIDYVRELNEIAHQEDPQRMTTAASFLSDGDQLNTVTDLIAWNKYYGWYGGTPESLGQWLDHIHRNHPDYRIGISEYGAGASIYHQQDSIRQGSASGWWHPENYQTEFHSKSWQAIAQREFVWGSFIWNLFDFGAAHRTEGDRPGINDKGLVTFDRKTKKDAFFFYKANWNTRDKFVYIANRRHSVRHQPTTTVTIYSNMPEVELIVNGQSIGTQKSDGWGTFIFSNITLLPGTNTIAATAGSGHSRCYDKVIWTLE